MRALMAVMESRIGIGVDLLFDVADTASSVMIPAHTPRGRHVVQAAASQERQEAKSGNFWQRRLLRIPWT
jgi:hypothetical protein